jgi:hypothetical protein
MTFQRPAYEQVTIAHGGNTVALRPTLRAAATLEERHGFPALFRALDELNFTIICDIILSSSPTGQVDAAGFLSLVPGSPLFPFLVAVRQPLADLVSMFMPAADPKARPSTGSKPIPWAEVYGTLYDSATGWLGWTPETAWNATPTEITRAMSAHFDRLVTTGVLVRDDKQHAKDTDPEQVAQNEAAGLDPEFDRAGLRALKAKLAGGA